MVKVNCCYIALHNTISNGDHINPSSKEVTKRSKAIHYLIAGKNEIGKKFRDLLAGGDSN